MTAGVKPYPHFLVETAIMAKSVPEKVRPVREALGYSLDDLAETWGLTIGEIAAIEAGSDSDLGRLRRVARALQLSEVRIDGTTIVPQQSESSAPSKDSSS